MVQLEDYEALEKFDVVEMWKRQKILDDTFDEKPTGKKRTRTELRISYFDELGELTHEMKPNWNWWKIKNAPINLSLVQEELSDVLHFYLSYIEPLNTNILDSYEDFYKRYTEIDINILWNIYTKVDTNKEFNVVDELNKALCMLTKLSDMETEQMFLPILFIAHYSGGIEKFLEVHHNKWIKNMTFRMSSEY
jgi:dUTP diphosphatase